MNTNRLLLIACLLAVPAAGADAAPRGKGRAAAKETGVNHTVQRGETLFSIAEKYYGSGYEWVRLKEYNPFIDDAEHLNIGEKLFIPDPRRVPSGAAAAAGGEEGGLTSLNPASRGSLFAWMPTFGNISFFGRSLGQLILIAFGWFVLHSGLQGVFVWFAAHLAFVKDVTLKKALRATVQSESLAFICITMAALVGFMLLYVGTTSPGKPLSAELLSTAEEYLGSRKGMAISGLLLMGLYGFLGIRFIPSAFGIQAGRGLMVVVISIFLPHILGMYLMGHRMGLLE